MCKFKSAIAGIVVALSATLIMSVPAGAAELNLVEDGLVDKELVEETFEFEEDVLFEEPEEDSGNDNIANDTSGDVVKSGTLSTGIKWELTGGGSSYKLTFTGTGEMPQNIWLSDMDIYDYQDQITEVVLGEGITKMSNSCCSSFSSLRTVTLPSTLTEISNSAFRYCGKLGRIEIPSSVQRIGDGAFEACSELVTVKIPENSMLTQIGSYAFESCRSLTNINLVNSGNDFVIGNYAFYRSSLTRITIPSNVTEIGQEAFRGSELQSITFEDGSRLKKIGDMAFYNTLELKEIILPETGGSLEIGRLAFLGSGIEKAVISSGVCGTGESWFCGCSKLSSITFPERGQLLYLGDEMFNSCRSLTGIEIPSYIKGIGKYTFGSCNSLMSISIPDSVTEIGEYAFNNCTALESIRLPSNLDIINNSVFSDCGALKAIILPSSLEKIDNWAFINCKSLKSIRIPASITAINMCAFYGCERLQTFIVDKDSKLEFIGSSAFYYCKGLKTLVLPQSLTRIGEDAFAYCDGKFVVYYTGSEADWNNIVIDYPENGNGWIVEAKKYYNYDYSNLPDVPDDDPTPEYSGVVIVGQKLDLTGEAYFGRAYTSYKSNSKAASVSSKGVLKANKAASSVNITAYEGKGRNAKAVKTISFKIEKPDIPKSKKTITFIAAGETIDASTVLTGTSVKPTCYVSSNPAIASVDADTGLVTAISKGNAEIKILFGSNNPKDKNTAKYSFKIKADLPKISKKSATLMTGQTLALKLGNVKKGKTVTWQSSSQAVTVNEGKVEVLAWEEQPVEVFAIVDGASYTCIITVKKPELVKTEFILATGKSESIKLKNTKLKLKDITFVSSDNDVATVDQSTGKIKAVKSGNCQVTVTVGGVEYVCNVTVK